MNPTREEEQELFRRIAAGETELRHEAVTRFNYLIQSNMRQFHFDREDIAQECVIALYRAVDRFDYTRRLRFSTYAAHWVRQAAFSYIYDHGSTVRIPVYMRKLINRIGRSEDTSDSPKSAIATAVALSTRSTYTLSDINDPEAPMGVEKDELSPLIFNAMSKLTDRERHIVYQRFFKDRTFKSIGKEEGVSLERVRQILRHAISKMRTPELKEWQGS